MHSNSINLAQLMAFRATAESGSISKAAQHLRVSQPAVSKHLKNLEDICKTKLFERRSSPIDLTDAGHVLLRHTNIIHSQIDDLRKDLDIHAILSASGPLKVAGSFAASALLLPSVLATFKRKYRERPVILRTCTTNVAKTLVLNSKVEIALLNENPADSNLASEPFREERLVLFASPNHPLTKKARLKLSEIDGATLVAPAKSRTADKFLKDLVQEGLRINISMHCGTQDSVKTIVKKGVGIGILFKDFVMPEIRKKVFKPIEIPGIKLKVRSYIVYRKDRPLSQHAQDFLALLRKRAQKRMPSSRPGPIATSPA